MLYRRIKHHVTNENWFAVGVDFFIVVVGVYVGLEVSNINEDRQERQRAISYLERIRADLESDIETGNATETFWGQVIEYGKAAISHAETGALANESAAKTLLAYYQASQVGLYSAVDTTYLELKGAAEFRLIRDKDLLASLSHYYVWSSGLQVNHLMKFSPPYREHIRGLMPWDIQTFIWAECHGSDRVNQYLLDCDIPVGNDEAAAILQVFVSDPETIEGLRFWIANLSVSKGVLNGNVQKAAELVEQIDATLANIS